MCARSVRDHTKSFDPTRHTFAQQGSDAHFADGSYQHDHDVVRFMACLDYVRIVAGGWWDATHRTTLQFQGGCTAVVMMMMMRRKRKRKEEEEEEEEEEDARPPPTADADADADDDVVDFACNVPQIRVGRVQGARTRDQNGGRLG